MKAVWYERQGEARAVLEQGEVTSPTAGRGELRIGLHASGVNPADCNRRAGRGYPMEFGRIIPHNDGAGVVEAVGEGVDGAWIGKRVWLTHAQRGRPFGTAAETIALDSRLATPLPDTVSLEQGACLGIPCIAAYHALFGEGELRDHCVAVHGGAGAVGHFAVQLAKWAGARVLATVRSEPDVAVARDAGADAVMLQGRDDLAESASRLTGGAGVDRIVDVDLAANLSSNVAALRIGGTLVAYASASNRYPALPFYEMLRKNLTLRMPMLSAISAEARATAQRGITRWLQEGRFRIRVSEVFPLARTADAHEAVESGRKRGTVVVRCRA